jgi:hypothetical protein
MDRPNACKNSRDQEKKPDCIDCMTYLDFAGSFAATAITRPITHAREQLNLRGIIPTLGDKTRVG